MATEDSLDQPADGVAALEDYLEEFDAIWRNGSIPEISAFLPPPQAAERRPVLEELIKIDLEYRWRRAGHQQPNAVPSPPPASDRGLSRTRTAFPLCPLVEDYVTHYPELGSLESLSLGLIVEEYRVRHPGIVAIHDIGRDQDTIYIVSDLVRGVSLQDWLSAQRPDFRAAAELVAQLADALDCAHRQGIVHRDLKPANILLELRAVAPAAGAGAGLAKGGTDLRRLQPRITDFGLAKCADVTAQGSLDGQIVGTPAYMSPEQVLQPRAVDGRSDLYSLGVILYELLTGELPFDGEARTLLLRLTSQPPKPPRQLNERVPHDLETITLKCLRKEPARRYPTAGELATDLRRWLAGEPIQARAVGRAERFWLWCRRSPVRAGLAAALLLALLAGTVLAVILAQHRHQAVAYARRLQEIDEQRTRLLREIDVNRAALLEKLDEEKRRQQQTFADDGEPAEETEAVPTSPEVQALADRLKSLLAQVRSNAGPQTWAEDGDFPVRLAEATLANAEQRFDKALEIVALADVQVERARTDDQIEREVKVNRVRGDALYGMRKWAQALECYQRIVQLQPTAWEYRRRVAECLYQLKKQSDGLAEYGRIIDELTRLVEKQGRAELANDLAISLDQRGNILRWQSKDREALPDVDKAVVIRTRLVEKEGHKDKAADLANSLYNRGEVLRILGKPADAYADQDKSVSILTQLVEEEGQAALAGQLAASLNGRGNASRALRKLPEALADFDKAVTIRTRLVEHEGRKDLLSLLATSLNSRGEMQRSQAKLVEALADFDKAVAIRTQLVEKEGRKGEANNLAWSLGLRGGLQRSQGKLAEALADFDKAVAIRTQLVEKEGRKHLANALAALLMSRGDLLRIQGKLVAALADLDKAVTLRTRLVEQEGRKDLTAELARVLDRRGLIHLDLCRLTESKADHEKAVAIFTQLVEQEGQKDLADLLAANQRWLDRVKTVERVVEDLDLDLKHPPQQAAELLMICARLFASRGQHAQAAAAGDKVYRLESKQPYFLFWAARCYALGVSAVAVGKEELSAEDRAQQGKYADQAMDLLKQAIGRGYKDVTRLRYEPDLDSLRSRDDFKKLLAEVEAKAKEGPK